MPIWHQSPKLTPRYFLETPRLFGYPITIKLLEYAYVSSHVGYTYIILFTNPIIDIQEKKANHLYNPFSHHIHIHRYFWFCEYVYHP